MTKEHERLQVVPLWFWLSVSLGSRSQPLVGCLLSLWGFHGRSGGDATRLNLCNETVWRCEYQRKCLQLGRLAFNQPVWIVMRSKLRLVARKYRCRSILKHDFTTRISDHSRSLPFRSIYNPEFKDQIWRPTHFCVSLIPILQISLIFNHESPTCNFPWHSESMNPRNYEYIWHCRIMQNSRHCYCIMTLYYEAIITSCGFRCFRGYFPIWILSKYKFFSGR